MKDAIDQALILRGSRDFDTTKTYADFLGAVVNWRNRLVQGKLEQETLCLGSLPPAPVPEYVNYQARVRKWSTIQVAKRTYSVPPSHRQGGADPAVRRLGGSLLQGPPGGMQRSRMEDRNSQDPNSPPQ